MVDAIFLNVPSRPFFASVLHLVVLVLFLYMSWLFYCLFFRLVFCHFLCVFVFFGDFLGILLFAQFLQVYGFTLCLFLLGLILVSVLFFGVFLGLNVFAQFLPV